MDESFTTGSRGSAFRILIVDDDPVTVHLLRELMEGLRHRYELRFAKDGVEALEVLHQKAPYGFNPRLILLDINMPRLGGLETLSAIKSDPELSAIPVLMLSTSNSPIDVRESYWAKANCYLQKPSTLDQYTKLIQAIEAFWIDMAIVPQTGEPHYGRRIAAGGAEARSRALRKSEPPNRALRRSGCEEYHDLLDEFGTAVRGLIELHEQQYEAIVGGDNESHRFDLLIHMANEKKQLAKYACLRHVEEHGCSNSDAIDQSRT